MNRPEFVEDEHLEYLEGLRASGDTNMMGALPYLLESFPDLDKNQGKDILFYWMQLPPEDS